MKRTIISLAVGLAAFSTGFFGASAARADAPLGEVWQCAAYPTNCWGSNFYFEYDKTVRCCRGWYISVYRWCDVHIRAYTQNTPPYNKCARELLVDNWGDSCNPVAPPDGEGEGESGSGGGGSCCGD